MRLSIWLFLLLPCWLAAQELSVEQDIALTVRNYQEKASSAKKAENWGEVGKWIDLAYATVMNARVKPVYLEDQHGELWNLGVLNQPFVVHGIANFSGGLSEMKIAAANVVAEENATRLMTFLLMPTPVNARDSQRLASISDKIVVVFMEMVEVEDRKADDARLLSLLNSFPITYCIRANREIVGIHIGTMAAGPKRENIPARTKEEAHKSNLKELRKDVRALLRGKRIKRY